MTIRIVIADDHPLYREGVAHLDTRRPKRAQVIRMATKTMRSRTTL